MPTKAERYRELVKKRKACAKCPSLTNPATIRANDSEQIGPWTRLDGDLSARLMVVGKDWGTVAYYTEYEGLDAGRNPRSNRANKNLEGLLRVAGFAEPLSFDGEPRGLFLTNAVLCLKQGSMTAHVKRQCFTNCGWEFLRKQIEIVRPAVVVAMGVPAYSAILAAFELPPVPPKAFREAVEDECGTPLLTGVTLLAVYHCGQQVINSHCREADEQIKDWTRVQKALTRARGARTSRTV